jgi:hypothetical protein
MLPNRLIDRFLPNRFRRLYPPAVIMKKTSLTAFPCSVCDVNERPSMRLGSSKPCTCESSR